MPATTHAVATARRRKREFWRTFGCDRAISSLISARRTGGASISRIKVSTAARMRSSVYIGNRLLGTRDRPWFCRGERLSQTSAREHQVKANGGSRQSCCRGNFAAVQSGVVVQDNRTALLVGKRRKRIIKIHGVAVVEVNPRARENIQRLRAWPTSSGSDCVSHDDSVTPRVESVSSLQRRECTRHRGTRLLRRILR